MRFVNTLLSIGGFTSDGIGWDGLIQFMFSVIITFAFLRITRAFGMDAFGLDAGAAPVSCGCPDRRFRVGILSESPPDLPGRYIPLP